VSKNYPEALRLNRLTAKQGDIAGINNLGIMYWDGLGVKQDLVEAARLFKIAIAKGSKEAENNLQELLKNKRPGP
jgi:TPR repeat protein